MLERASRFWGPLPAKPDSRLSVVPGGDTLFCLLSVRDKAASKDRTLTTVD